MVEATINRDARRGQYCQNSNGKYRDKEKGWDEEAVGHMAGEMLLLLLSSRQAIKQSSKEAIRSARAALFFFSCTHTHTRDAFQCRSESTCAQSQ